MGSSTSNLATKVDLSGRGIADLERDLKQPHLLPAFARLQVLNLKGNKISTIPPSIVNDLQRSPNVIEHLQSLNFSKNNLSQIPPAIFILGTFSPIIFYRRLCFEPSKVCHPSS